MKLFKRVKKICIRKLDQWNWHIVCINIITKLSIWKSHMSDYMTITLIFKPRLRILLM